MGAGWDLGGMMASVSSDWYHLSGITGGGLTIVLAAGWEEHLSLLLMQGIIAAWVFALGACFGSFLNVVIFRLPAGLSLQTPKSRCPRCETQLAARDNIPVFGWLFLKGRCRYCELPISARYPVIEFVCGAVFLILMLAELVTGAANLPLQDSASVSARSGYWLVWFGQWELSATWLYHCTMLVLVLAIAMIGYDGHSPHRNLITFTLAVAVAGSSLLPFVHPVPALPWPDWMADLRWGFNWKDMLFRSGNVYWTGISLTGFLNSIAGILVGYLAGRLVAAEIRAPNTGERTTASSAIYAAMPVTGAFLGWHACGTLALLMIPILAVIAACGRKESSVTVPRWTAPGYFGLLFAFLLSWRQLDEAVWMIGHRGWTFSPLGWQYDWLATASLLVAFVLFVRYRLNTVASHADWAPEESPELTETSEPSTDSQ